jgi:NADH-quinone oxidoreductase subunit C
MISQELQTALAALAVNEAVATDFKARGFHLDVAVDPDAVAAAAEILNLEGFFLEAITGIDWLADGQMEVVYDYNHAIAPGRIVIRTRTNRATPEVPTVSGVFPAALWHERETHDFFGIVFTGHPDLKPLLLPEDADFHPLRKDYTP